MLDLLVARLALRLVPFRWLTSFFELPPRRPEDTVAERRRICASISTYPPVGEFEITGAERAFFRDAMRSFIEEAAWFLPGETVCFPRAIAAQALLRRLGMRTTLYYGAATLPGRGLTAHVWLQDKDYVVVGHCDGEVYCTLASYPRENTDNINNHKISSRDRVLSINQGGRE